jgi:UDP-N-acetylmuramate--alanine ligase
VKVEGLRLHFVGIGGVGMSALAELALRRGAIVGGSDLVASATTARLERLGVRIFPPGHRAEYVVGADVVVRTSAAPESHPEVAAARANGARVLKRAEFMAACVENSRVVAIAGAHGKTTTTAMTGGALVMAGLDPTILVGGFGLADGANLRVGGAALSVVEADEYDRSFLALKPSIAVVGNVDREHLDVYGDMEGVRAAFATFASSVGPGGIAWFGVDDPEAAALVERTDAPRATFGLSPKASLRAAETTFGDGGSKFVVFRDGERLGTCALRIPGVHNVKNALAAIAAATSAGAPFESVAAALETFAGVGRRFERLGRKDGAIVVDDYAHHPTELRATIAAARLHEPERRLVVVFQPHLYSRTRDLKDEFAAALAGADVVLIAPIYPARERPIVGVDASMILDAPGLAARAGSTAFAAETADGVRALLHATVRPKDLLLVAGAGDVRRFAEEWLRS